MAFRLCGGPHLIRASDEPCHALNQLRFAREDVDAALEDLGEAFDIERDDLAHLLERVALQAVSRRANHPLCADIMSHDLITIHPDASPDEAQRLLIDHHVRTLPVLDSNGRLLGSIGLREAAQKALHVRDVMRAALTARADTPAIDLLAPLTDGVTHAVVVTNEQGYAEGLVTQTDLLTALTRDLRKAA